ncbi:MAG: gluconate 2-dehydrogenase subunit 3 family protein, partial [Pseudomonadota bacterium]
MSYRLATESCVTKCTRRQALISTIVAGGSLLLGGCGRSSRKKDRGSDSKQDGANPASRAAETAQREPSPFEPRERACLSAVVERILPGAVDAGVVEHLEYWGRTRELAVILKQLRRGAIHLDRVAEQSHRRMFVECSPAEQDAILSRFAKG